MLLVLENSINHLDLNERETFGCLSLQKREIFSARV